jgi:hypothetical protein
LAVLYEENFLTSEHLFDQLRRAGFGIVHVDVMGFSGDTGYVIKNTPKSVLDVLLNNSMLVFIGDTK